MTLRVTEKGCPTVEFPYIISYASNDGLEAVSIYKEGEQPQPAAIETATAPAQDTAGSAPAPPSKRYERSGKTLSHTYHSPHGPRIEVFVRPAPCEFVMPSTALTIRSIKVSC